MMIKDISNDLPKHRSKKYAKRYLSDISSIVLHHTVGNGDAKSFAEYHVSRGWPGIGYHFLIDAEGLVYQTNTIDTISYNVAKNNRTVIGISIIGNYEETKLNAKQKRSIKNLIKILKVIVGDIPVKGHMDFKPTLCPGKNIIEYIKTLNNELSS